MTVGQKICLPANNKIASLPPRQQFPPASPCPAIFFGPIATSVHCHKSFMYLNQGYYSKLPIQEVEPWTSQSDFILPLSLAPPATTLSPFRCLRHHSPSTSAAALFLAEASSTILHQPPPHPLPADHSSFLVLGDEFCSKYKMPPGRKV